MLKKISLFFVIFISLFCCRISAEELNSKRSPDNVFDKIRKSIVGIRTIQKKNDLGSQALKDMDTREFFNKFYPEAGGLLEGDCLSGVAIDKEGWILTILEPVRDAEEIFIISPDGRKEEAVLKGEDERLNLALLKVDSRLNNTIDISKKDAEIGENVLAAGNPFGVSEFSHFVTSGILSSINQKIPERDYLNIIQTDAVVNPLNNGGPLVNKKGEIVGINLYVKNAGPLYYAISVNSNAIDSIKKYKKLQYGWVGMRVQEEFTPLEKVSSRVAGKNIIAEGGSASPLEYSIKDNSLTGLKGETGSLIVVDIVKNGPADKAGFMEKDIIKSFNGKKPRGVSDLARIVATSEVGSRASVSVIRDNKEINLYVNIEPKPKLKK